MPTMGFMAPAQEMRSSSGIPTRTNYKVASMVVEIEIQPKVKLERYDRDIQCDLIDPKKADRLQRIAEEDDDSDEADAFEARMARAMKGVQNEPRRNSHHAGLVSASRQDTLLAQGKLCAKCLSEKEQDSREPKYLSKEVAKKTVEEQSFQDFFSKSSRLVERALGQEFKLSKNFFVEDDEEGDEDDVDDRGDRLTKKFTFSQTEHLNRAVTSIDWSPNHPELLLASYSKCNEWSLDEADGLIHLYSISLQGRPEMVLNCQYEVTKAMFNPFDPNVIIGATQAGYLLEWDVRAKKEPISGIIDRRNRSQPIQKSCLAQNGHTYPIYSLSVVGSQSSHNIVSISNDGKMCLWKPKMLQEPKDHYFLESAQNLTNMAGMSRTATLAGSSILKQSSELSALSSA